MATAFETRLALLSEAHTAICLANSLLFLATDFSEGSISDVTSEAGETWQIRNTVSVASSAVYGLYQAVYAQVKAAEAEAKAIADVATYIDADPFADE